MAERSPHIRWATLGGHRIVIQEERSSFGRDLVKHRYPKRDGAQIRDQGAKEGTWSLDVHFIDWNGTDYDVAYRNIREAMEGGAVVTYQPPHDNEVRVRIESMDNTVSVRGNRYIRSVIELVQDLEEESALVADASSVDALVQDFDLAVKEVEEALEALEAAEAGGLL